MLKGTSMNEYSPWEDCQASQREAAWHQARRAAAVPAYGDRWEAASAVISGAYPADWETIPYLTKDELIQASQDFPPFGNRLAVAPAELGHVFVAPGPLYMPYTAADLRHISGSFAKAFRSCGLASDDIVDQTTMYNWVIAATVFDQALQSVGCAVMPGGVGQTERHVEAIRDVGATAIVAFPTFLEHLLDTAGTMNVRLPLKKAVVMGELSHPDAKQRLRSAFGLHVREFYGAADVGAVAWECQAGDGMHLRDDLLVEFLDPATGKPADPTAAAPTELVVTDLWRQAMPIIRLRTGDLIDQLRHEPCSCGRTSPRFGRIVGRASEITKVKGMFVVPKQVQDILARRDINCPFRLVVTRQRGGQDELTLEIADPKLEAAEEIKAIVERALRVHIQLRLVETLPADSPRLVDLRLTTDAPVLAPARG
ncbi:phenylacetate-CoA ligase [Rhodoligotrophos appendicifer]|uniref:phenylacetate--CoA ligase family protein n=1 Tax=Rhodoligotrophos appendicifer TaxID=987056 RepID=UPI001186F18D|nr:AMP-binding protein [Rhodoligotrophos appendicifer]